VPGLLLTPLRRWLLLVEARCRGWAMLLLRALLWRAAELLLACAQAALLSLLLQDLHLHPRCLRHPHCPLNPRLHLQSQAPPNLS
jgi:hypothetical protein